MSHKIVYTLLSMIVSVLVFYIIYNANWLLGDQAEFLSTTAIGKIEPLSTHINTSNGRFYPLGHYSYNILTLFPLGKSVVSHFILNAVSFLIFVAATLILIHKIVYSSGNSKLNDWIILFTLTFLFQRVYSVFIDIIFPERTVITLMFVFMLAVYQFFKTDKWLYGIIGLICSVYMVYCKEPLFLSFIIFALTNVIFNWKELSFNNRIFQLILVLNSLIFILLYYFLVYRNITFAYVGNHGENNWIRLIIKMIWSNKIFFIGIILFFIRAYTILFRKDRNHLFYDGLLFAGLAYFFACLILKLNYTYYYLPALALFTPAIVYWLIRYIKPLGAFGVMLFLALFYVIKFPTLIYNNQSERIITYPKIEKITKYISAGYQLIWYNAESPTNKSWNQGLIKWQKTSLQTYIAHILKDEKYCFNTVNSLSEVKDSNYLLLYPIENDLINDTQAIQFKNKIKQIDKDTILQIKDIRVIKLSNSPMN